MLLIALVIFAVGDAFSLADLAVGNQGISTFIQVVGQIVGLLLTLGLIRATLAVTRAEEPRVSMLFETDRFGSYLVASILFVVGLMVTMFTCVLIATLVGSSVLSAVVFVVTGLGALIAYVAFYSFFGWVIVDQDESGPIEALQRSARLVSGRFWLVVRLVAALILITIPGMLLIGIGLLLTNGMTGSASVYAYRALSGIGVFFTLGIINIALAYAYRMLSGESVAPAR